MPFLGEVSLCAIADRISLMGFPLEVHLVVISYPSVIRWNTL